MAEAITDEFGNVDLADARRNRRLNAVVTALSQAPAASISGASGGWHESVAAYRLLSSAKVKPQALLAPHQQAVARRCADHACVIVSQDTTELDFTRMKEMQGLGPLNSLERRGFFMHSLYAATEAGLPLGLWDLQIMVRSDETFHRNLSETRPIEEKESLRWIEGYHKTCELARALPQCEVFSISDREGDIFELYAAWQKEKKDIRSAQPEKGGKSRERPENQGFERKGRLSRGLRRSGAETGVVTKVCATPWAF